MIGASTPGAMTFSTIAEPLMESLPPATRPAPMRPPIRAWLEDDGSPAAHVSRFQAIAPTRAANSVRRSRTPSSTIPCEIVAATLMDRNAPAKFSAAQSATATLGRKARVAMDVAIAFAVSWKPLVKSKTRALPMTITRRSSDLFTLAALPVAQRSSRSSPLRNKWCQVVRGRGVEVAAIGSGLASAAPVRGWCPRRVGCLVSAPPGVARGPRQRAPLSARPAGRVLAMRERIQGLGVLSRARLVAGRASFATPCGRSAQPPRIRLVIRGKLQEVRELPGISLAFRA
jgi:hypothetical protein